MPRPKEIRDNPGINALADLSDQSTYKGLVFVQETSHLGLFLVYPCTVHYRSASLSIKYSGSE